MEQNVKTCSGKPVLLCSGWEEIQFQYGGVISFGFGWLLGCFSFCWFFLFVALLRVVLVVFMFSGVFFFFFFFFWCVFGLIWFGFFNIAELSCYLTLS